MFTLPAVLTGDQESDATYAAIGPPLRNPKSYRGRSVVISRLLSLSDA